MKNSLATIHFGGEKISDSITVGKRQTDRKWEITTADTIYYDIIKSI